MYFKNKIRLGLNYMPYFHHRPGPARIKKDPPPPGAGSWAWINKNGG